MIEYGVDFETYYETARGSSYSLKKMTVHDYVHDDRFDAYMVAIFSDKGTIYVGPPEEAPWEEMDGQTWVSHNMAFDYQVYQRLVDLGKVKPIYPEEWHCTANLSAYLQAPRNLQAACRELLEVDISKEVRDEMANKSYYDLTVEEKKEWLDYAIDDAKYSLQLWQKYQHEWPEVERFVSMATIMQGIQGVNINVDKLVKGKKTLKDVLFDSAQKIPWRKDYVLLSTKGMKAECAKQGIAPPPTTSQKDDRFDRWVEKHKDYNIDWIDAVGHIRKANKCLKFLETVESRLREDNTMYFSTKYFGAAVTGRWSGESGLNMQNLTKNKTFGVGVRDLFIPRKGKVFIISDLSQVEPRCSLAGTPIYVKRACGRKEWIKIETLQKSDLVFDGNEFVMHGGLLSKEERNENCGFLRRFTRDHEIYKGEYEKKRADEFTTEDRKKAEEFRNASWEEVWKLALFVGVETTDFIKLYLSSTLRRVRRGLRSVYQRFKIR